MTIEYLGRRFSIDLKPLSPLKALLAFGVVYIATILAWHSLPSQAVNDLRNFWPAFLVPGVPVFLYVARKLWALLADVTFASTLLAAVVAVCFWAFMRFSADAAYANVFDSCAFVLLLAALCVSLVANMAATPWTSRRAPHLILQLGILVALAGAFWNIHGRVSGTATLVKSSPESSMTLNDFVLTVVSQEGAWTRVPLTMETLAAARKPQSVDAGDISVEVACAERARQSDAAGLELTASDGTETRTLSLFYNGGFAPLEIGRARHRVAFGPTRLTLPLEMSLNYAGSDNLSAGAAPYDAYLTLREKASGRTLCAQLCTGSRFRAYGYSFTLVSVNKPWMATLRLVREPGRPLLLTGAYLAALSLAIAAWMTWISPVAAGRIVYYCRAIAS